MLQTFHSFHVPVFPKRPALKMDETGLLELWVPHIYMCMCASAFENASLSFQISAFGKNQTRLELEQKL